MAVVKTTDYRITSEHLQLIDKFFNDEMKKKLDQMVFMKIFGEETNNHLNDTVVMQDWVDGIEYIPENAEYPDIKPGGEHKMTFTKYKYGWKIVITEEMIRLNDYTKLPKIVRSATQRAFDKIEQSLADMFPHGFSTASYVDVWKRTMHAIGDEGRALFNNDDKTIITLNNNQNPELSLAALDAIYVMGTKHRDAQGNHKSISYDTLLVPPALRSKADILVNSDRIPGSNDNAPNPIKGRFKVVVSTWLGGNVNFNGSDVNTDKYWYVFDSSNVKDQLRVIWAWHPQIVHQDVNENTNNHVSRLSFMYSRGFLNMSYVAGSTWETAVAKEGVAVEIVNGTSNPVPVQTVS